MAVQPQTPYKEYDANGVAKSFNLEFDCENKDHLIVTIDGVEPPVETWSLNSGQIVFASAPAAGKKIEIKRNTPYSRSTNFQAYDNSFRPGPVNGDFDRIWLKLQELGVADWLMRLYVDRLHQQQEQKINDLKGYVDDRDDELRAYLLEEIRKQGVALDQLDEYYNYLMQRLAQIAVQGGWEASFVVDASGKNQQEINDNVLFRVKSIIELRAFIPLFDGQKVVLDGFYEASQDGFGDFVWDAASTETVVPGIVEKVNLLTIGRFKRVIVNNTISLLDTGSIRDGVTETHDQVIAALRFCNSNKVDCYAPHGTYLMGLQAQIDLINGGNFGLYGDSEGQTIFKERDGLTAEKGKFNKTLYFLANTGIIVDRLAIKNILVDKNGRTSPLTPEQLSTDIWAYEQAHCIGISTSWTNSKIKFLDIENVTTKDKLGAGICLMAGRADVVSVKNIKGIDFQFNGGERADFEFQMHVKNLVLADSSGTYIQAEYDNLVATDTLRMTMKRCKYDMVDIACTSDATKQLVFFEDVQAGRLLHVRNCTVFGKNVTGKVGTIAQEYWFNLGVGSEFDETCDFIIDARTDVTPRVTKPFYLRTGELTFKGRFVAGDGFEETVNGFAVTNQAFYDGSNIQHKLVLDGARFDNKFERSVNAYANGNFVIKRCKLAGRAGAFNAIAVGGFSTYYSNVELEDNDLSQLGTGLLQYTATNNLFSVVFKGEHDYAKSGFTSSNQTNSNSQTKCLGSFYSTSAPGIGYQGAVVRILGPALGRPVVYQNLTGNSVAASAVWCVSSQAGLASGNTASRPTVTSKENGLRYHNTETAKIETWNGIAWV